MKKLKLQKLNLESSEVLSREQLKNVIGGGSAYCGTLPRCGGPSYGCCEGGMTCRYIGSYTCTSW